MANLFDDLQAEITHWKVPKRFQQAHVQNVKTSVENRLRRLAEENAAQAEELIDPEDPNVAALAEARAERVKAAGAEAFKVDVVPDKDLTFAVTGLTQWAQDLLNKADDTTGRGKTKTLVFTRPEEA